MLTALHNNTHIILGVNNSYSEEELRALSDNRELLCPVYHKPYEYCHGKIVMPYFRHKDKTECENIYSEPETDEHIRGKIRLYNWLQNIDGVTDVELEAYIPETKQRPDIKFMYHDRVTVLEYQCTPIASEYLERHELYQNANIDDIWICGVLNYFDVFHEGNGYKRMSTIEKHNHLYYDPFNDYLFHVDHNMSEQFWWKILNGDCYNQKICNYQDLDSTNFAEFYSTKYAYVNHDKENKFFNNDMAQCIKLTKWEEIYGRNQCTAV